MTAEAAEPGTATTRNATVTGTLPPAQWRVKRILAGFEAGEDQMGQTGVSAAAIRASVSGSGVRATGMKEPSRRNRPQVIRGGREIITGR